MTTSATPATPTGFWGQIGHQLDRITRERPADFAALRAVLLDPAYDEVLAYVNGNGPVTFSQNQAFFAGTGGDRSVLNALIGAGWDVVHSDDQYSCTLSSPVGPDRSGAGELVEYCEGDLTLIARGDLPLGPSLTAQHSPDCDEASWDDDEDD